MKDWHAIVYTPDSFTIRRYFATDEAVSSATLGNNADIKALLVWLESIRYSGPAVDMTAVTREEVEDAVDGRTYEFEQSNGDDVRFSLRTGANFGVLVLLDGRTVRMYVNQEAASPDDFSSIHFSLALDDVTVMVTGVEGAQEKPPIGSTEVEMIMQRALLDGGVLEIQDNHPVIEVLDDRNEKHRIVLGYGITRPYSSLLAAPASAKYPPLIYAPECVIHFGPDEPANGKIRLRDPFAQIPVGDSGDWHLIVHNREDPFDNNPKTLEIVDWENDNVLTLLAGEQCALRMVRREDGTGELIDAVPVIREAHFAGANIGNVGGLGGYLSDGTGYRARPILLPLPNDSDTSIYRLHTEAMDVGNNALSAGSSMDTVSASGLSIPQAIIFQKPGHVAWQMTLNISTGGTSGNIPKGHGLAFYRKRGSTLLRGPREVSKSALYNNGSDTWSLAWEIDVDLADILIPMFRYHGTTTSLGFSNVNIDSVDFSMRMTEIVHREYAA